MIKVSILLAVTLAIAVSAQENTAEQNAAPEPYAYAYQTDTHSASEQRTPDGKVTGFYTIVDPTDGRERRVEYVADEAGFRAKVATNELGTKSENSADVEVLASPPSEAQLVYQAPQQQQVVKQQVVAYQQQMPRVTYTQIPAVNTATTVQQAPSVRYVQQPGYNYGYGYYPGYGYATNGYGYQGATGYGLNAGSYNYHTPTQYYSSYQGGRVGTVQGVTYQPGVSGYTFGGAQNGAVDARYVTSSTGGVRAVPVGATRTLTSGSGNLGSGNLLLLKK